MNGYFSELDPIKVESDIECEDRAGLNSGSIVKSSSQSKIQSSSNRFSGETQNPDKSPGKLTTTHHRQKIPKPGPENAAGLSLFKSSKPAALRKAAALHKTKGLVGDANLPSGKLTTSSFTNPANGWCPNK